MGGNGIMAENKKTTMEERYQEAFKNAGREEDGIKESANKLVVEILKAHESMFKVFETKILADYFLGKGLKDPEEVNAIYKIHIQKLPPKGNEFARTMAFVADKNKSQEEAIDNPEKVYLLQTSLTFEESAIEITNRIDEMEQVEI